MDSVLLLFVPNFDKPYYRLLYFRGMHVTFRSLDPLSQMKETFCFDCKGDSMQRLVFLVYIIRAIPCKLQLN